MIRLAEDKDKDLWNHYVDSHPQGTFFHRFEWKQVIDKAIKLENIHFL